MKNNKNVNAPLFDDADYAAFKESGLTDAQISSLMDTAALVETVEMLPKDDKGLDKLIEKAKKVFSDKNVGKSINNFFELAKKDPSLFAQIVALFETMDAYAPAQASAVEKISSAQLTSEKTEINKEELKKATEEFLAAYDELSPEEKKLFLAKIKSGK